MSTSYELLTQDHAEHIRRQRLLDLEADHYRFILDLQELPQDQDRSAILQRIDDVERRIAIHRRALGLPPVVSTTNPDSTGVPEDDNELPSPHPADG